MTRRSPHASAPWRCVSLWSRRIPRSRATARASARRTCDSGRCDATWKTWPEPPTPGSVRCAHYDASKSLDGEHTFFRACCHAGLAGLAGRPGSGVSAAEGADQAEKAMAVLRQAVTMGYRNPDAYRTESALDPLRNRPDFRATDDGPGDAGRLFGCSTWRDTAHIVRLAWKGQVVPDASRTPRGRRDRSMPHS